MNEEEMRKIKIEGKCQDMILELESRGHVKVILEDGEEHVTMTKEGFAWFDDMTRQFKEEGILPQDYDPKKTGMKSMSRLLKHFDKKYPSWRDL